MRAICDAASPLDRLHCWKQRRDPDTKIDCHLRPEPLDLYVAAVVHLFIAVSSGLKLEE